MDLRNFSRLVLLIVFFEIFSSAEAQPPINYDFNNRDDISPGYPDSGIKPYYWNNGLLFLGFCTDSSQNNYGMTLTFEDTIGNIIWRKITFLPAYPKMEGTAIVSYNNSGFYVSGMVATSASQYKLFFAKFDNNGDSLFYKIFSDSTSNLAEDMIVFSADTLLVLCNWKVHDTDEYNRHIIYRMDTLGIMISSDSSILVAGRPAYQIMRGVNNRIYVGGTYKTAPGNNYYVKIFIDVYDDNLNELATWHPSNTLNEYFSQLNLLNNEIYLTSAVTAYNPPNTNPFFQFRIGKLNLSGTYQTYQNFGPLDFNPGGGKTRVVNQNCLAVPIRYSGNDGIYFVDSSCNVLCNADIGYPLVYTEYSDIIVTPSQKIAGTGYAYNFPYNPANTQDHWNFLTEPVEIFLSTNCGVGVHELSSSSGITVYPIPNNGQMTVGLNGKNYSAIHVFTTLGEEVYSLELDPNKQDQQLDILLANAAEGLYIIQVISKEGITSKKVLISK